MLRKCPQRQNEPIYLVLGFQLDDLYAGLAVIVLAVLFRQAMTGLLLAAVTVLVSRHLRKNKPVGRLNRQLHWLGLWQIPGCIPPQAQDYKVY